MKLFRIGLMLKEKPKDGRSLESHFLRNVLKFPWIVHVMTTSRMIFFARLKRKMKLPNKGGRNKKMKNEAIIEDAQVEGECII